MSFTVGRTICPIHAVELRQLGDRSGDGKIMESSSSY